MKSTIIAVALLGLVWQLGAQESTEAPIMDYYWGKAAAAEAAHAPSQATSLSFVARTFFHKVAPNGAIEKTDTLVAHRYYTRGELDSSVVVEGTPLDRPIILESPEIFSNRYLKNFFPNDTGGTSISIGLVSSSVDSTQPDGLVVVDRNDGDLRWLYLFYPKIDGFKRLTRSFRFVTVDFVVVPDSVWEVGITEGWYSGAHYRIETGISKIVVTP